ncbi:MAG: hypothetical protein J1E85_10295 [Ruminococcus sp.]|nr:hypothetical protein [Ruminococcus sp.]
MPKKYNIYAYGKGGVEKYCELGIKTKRKAFEIARQARKQLKALDDYEMVGVTLTNDEEILDDWYGDEIP